MYTLIYGLSNQVEGTNVYDELLKFIVLLVMSHGDGIDEDEKIEGKS